MPPQSVLILGGTQFVGRHIAQALLAAGHAVTLFNRGHTPDDLPHRLERLRGDRDAGPAGLAALSGRRWDACIDVSGYTPLQVRASATLLRDHVSHYIYMSAVSVYGDPSPLACPVREDHPRVDPAPEHITQVVGPMYGRLKVTCEDLVQELFPGRCALLRPQIVAGPHDPYDRYSYWVRRAALPGPILAPGDGADHLQVIDARDLARFTLHTLEHSLTGPFNLAGPRLTWSNFLSILDASSPTWVPVSILRADGITEHELPLFRPEHSPRSALMDVSSDHALAHGLILSSPRETAHWVREWLPHSTLTPALSPAREAHLLALAAPR